MFTESAPVLPLDLVDPFMSAGVNGLKTGLGSLPNLTPIRSGFLGILSEKDTILPGLRSPGRGNNSGGNTSRADLVVAGLTLNRTSLLAGESLQLTAAIANQGTGNAGASVTGFYLSQDQTLDSGDTLLGTVNTREIRAGRSTTVQGTFTLNSTLTGGTYYLIAQADQGQQISESNETNNLTRQTLTVQSPITVDLWASALTVNSFTQGQTSLTVSYQLTNGGTGSAASTLTALYLSTDGSLDAQDISLGTVDTPALNPGSTLNQTVTLAPSVLGNLTPGSYQILLKVDSNHQLAESNETNNVTSAPLTVLAPEPPLVDNWFTQNLQDGGLRTLGSQLGSDGILSRLDMIQLFTNAQDDGTVSATELTDLGLILNNGKTLFAMADHVYGLSAKILNGDPANLQSGIGNLSAGSSSTQLQQLVDKWFLGTHRPATPYTYSYASGSLVVNGFSVDDVRQGNLGDCYYLTALSAIAAKQPQFLQEMFIDNGDNTFTVKFYRPQGGVDYVTVDRYLPSAQGRFVYANLGDRLGNNGNELWVALAEKAYAQLAESGWSRPNLYQNSAYNTNSYQAIDTGWMNEAIIALTGLKTYNYTLNTTATMVESQLVNLVNSSRLVTIGFSNGQGLVMDDHAYSINRYDGNNRTFYLDNTWNNQDVALSWEQLRSLGGRLQYTV